MFTLHVLLSYVCTRFLSKARTSMLITFILPITTVLLQWLLSHQCSLVTYTEDNKNDTSSEKQGKLTEGERRKELGKREEGREVS